VVVFILIVGDSIVEAGRCSLPHAARAGTVPPSRPVRVTVVLWFLI